MWLSFIQYPVPEVQSGLANMHTYLKILWSPKLLAAWQLIAYSIIVMLTPYEMTYAKNEGFIACVHTCIQQLIHSAVSVTTKILYTRNHTYVRSQLKSIITHVTITAATVKVWTLQQMYY